MSAQATFAVKNFERFQHYKDRSPPWIRLYNSLLDDYDFGLLPDASKAHLLAIWLLASRYDNKIPFDPEWVSRRINATDPVDLATLAERGFIVADQDCITTLAERKQSAKPEERRGEQSRGEKIQAPLAGGALLVPENGSEKPDEEIPAILDKRRYPEDFEAVWEEYRPIASPNATKADAARAYGRLSAADKQACWTGVVRYTQWLIEERKKRGDYPAKHLATFINRRGWETFMEAA